jgi:MoxR-like ATPase
VSTSDVLASVVLDEAAATFASVVATVESVFVTPRPDVVTVAVACLVAGGHLLVEDLPGMGKTTLAKALAGALGLDMRRLQCTADLLPADAIGAMVLDPRDGQPHFRPGPVFTNVLVADELNRASPRTQSALLEAMEERQVSVDGTTAALPRPFMVIATQNPFDMAGTSLLPHRQRDRFLARIALGYPGPEHELALLAGNGGAPGLVDLAPAVTPAELAALMQAAAGVHSSSVLLRYVYDLVSATRVHPTIAVGASPRAALALLAAARSVAVSRSRPYVTPDDVQVMAVPVLAHRVLLEPGAEHSGEDAESLIGEVVASVPVPSPERASPPPDRLA